MVTLWNEDTHNCYKWCWNLTVFLSIAILSRIPCELAHERQALTRNNTCNYRRRQAKILIGLKFSIFFLVTATEKEQIQQVSPP